MVDTISAESTPELPPPSVPENLPYSFPGFEGKEAAEQWREIISSSISIISSWLNLERLDGVTVAVNYAEALATLDRGFETSVPLQASSDLVRGIGMAAPVIRNDVLKAQLVLDATYFSELIHPASPRYKEFVYLLAHECAHVHDMRARDLTFPGMLLRRGAPDIETGLRWQTSLSCWEEYAACRFSGSWNPDQIHYFEKTFCDFLDIARPRADERIQTYVKLQDEERLVVEVSREYRKLMTYASYVIGHLAGTKMELPETLDAKLARH